MQRAASPSLANSSNKAMSESAFLYLCNAFLSFRYSLQGTTPKCKNSEITTRLCFNNTFLLHFPLHPAPEPGKSWEAQPPAAAGGRKPWPNTKKERPRHRRELSSARMWLVCDRHHAVHREHGAEGEEFAPRTWAASKFRRGQMSLTFTVFQELKSLSSLPLTGEIAQNLFSFQSSPGGKKDQSLCKCICMHVPYFIFYKPMPTFSH